MSKIILFSGLFLIVAGGGDDSLVVQTRSGGVRGVREKAANGKDVDLWWGIPYAEPPVGELRFMPPKPVKK